MVKGDSAVSERSGQKSWGLLVVIYVFLAGCGGGTFLFSYLAGLLGWYEPVTRIGLVAGPVLVAVGSMMLIFDLGSPTRCYRLFTTPRTLASSWMIRGSWILSAFIILGLAYGLPSFSLFAWLPWSTASHAGSFIGVAAAVAAVFVPIYPGLLLGVIKGVPLWNTPALPLLFFLSGLDTGVAVLALVSAATPAAVGVKSFHLLAGADIVLIALLLIALLVYIGLTPQRGETAAASIRLLKRPVFTIGVVLCGMLVPLALSIAGTLASNHVLIAAVEALAGILVLSGGLLLRYSVITSGVRLTVR
jgi:formate-dependent nitrite reductase membrane component NrfD